MNKPAGNMFTQHFSNALRAFIKAKETGATAFFRYWFWDHGTCLFFLFKKNLRVTNIQFGELIALVTTHLQFPGRSRVPHLRFLSVPEFNSSLSRLDETFNLKSGDELRYASQAYSAQFGQTLVIDPFFCSCALYLPPLLRINLAKICGESGYIHSCGINLLTKLVYQTRIADFFEALGSFFAKKSDTKARVFTVYAREDWPASREMRPQATQDGLEHVKVPVNKFFVGPDRLSTILTKLRKRYGRKLLRVAQPGRYKQDHAIAVADSRFVEEQRTIFVITDQQPGESPRQPSDVRFYICYEQHYINENPFQIFDEDKPAWIDHTTIPHTLAAAMINITRPWWPPHRVKVCDPFSGSGTLWFEASKLPHVAMTCSDLSPVARVLTRDNCDFFCATFDQLKHWETMLNQLKELLPENKILRQQYEFGAEFNIAAAALEDWQIAFARDDYPTQRRILETVLADYSTQLIFYLILKTSKRNNARFGSEAWREFFSKEIENHVTGIKMLRGQKKRTEMASRPSTVVATGKGKYSESCYVDSRCLPKNQAVKIRSATTLARHHRRELDLIVTDPPYGFNTEEDQRGLADLYRRMIPAFLSALSDDGQLVIAIPDWSHTGRQLPAFKYKDFLTHAVLVEASNAGMDVVRAPYAMPRAGALFRAPFYWESERALRRAILHFRFQRSTAKRS